MIAEVAIPSLAIGKTLDFSILEGMELEEGDVVQCRVRGRACDGVVVALKTHSPFEKLQPVTEKKGLKLPPSLLKLAAWMSSYYLTPLDKVFKSFLPTAIHKKEKVQIFIRKKAKEALLIEAARDLRQKAPTQSALLDLFLERPQGLFLTEVQERLGQVSSSLKALLEKGLLKEEKIALHRSSLGNAEYFQTKKKILSAEQEEAKAKILDSLEKAEFATHLLFGITGSGKTEVYFQLIEEAKKQGKASLFLLPEVALTAQMIERLQSRFQEKIAVLHHALSDGERRDSWHAILKGDIEIVVGARSAIFAPIPKLGLIVVDEEHESSYKQTEEMPCYHARDVAVMRGSLEGCPVVLGSATPSLESYSNAKNGKYHLSFLRSRPKDITLPKLHLIDMKLEKEKGNSLFSQCLQDSIRKRLDNGEQTLLFLNRRGYNTSVSCQSCGKSVECPHCSLTLAFHKKEGALICHLCGHRSPPQYRCPTCPQGELSYRGIGTEQIEQMLFALFPGVRTSRVDRDTTRHKGSHEKLFRAFATGKQDILIGTQMIAKGIHFPQVTLVGVLQADAPLQVPDFRSSETLFQIITQVSGRSGRGELPGEVVIQSYLTDNEVLGYALKNDYEAFFSHETRERKVCGYPPHAKLIKITFSGMNEKNTLDLAQCWQQKLTSCLSKEEEAGEPIPAFRLKVKDLFRFQILLRGPSIGRLQKAVERTRQQLSGDRFGILIDVNPLSLL